MNKKTELIAAEKKAADLFAAIESGGYLHSSQTEKELNERIHTLAGEMYGIKKYWHKRIVRTGENTLHPYDENPPNLMIKNDDILFIDFGPIFEEWEADFGRTYVIGEDPYKLKLKNDIASAWNDAKSWFDEQDQLTCKDLFGYVSSLAKKYGWELGADFAGHLIGSFPHENIDPNKVNNYIHPESNSLMKQKSPDLEGPFWILEIHFVDKKRKIGGFYEQLLNI
ncbi:MAG: aminopeptidase P family protein [Cyclobacteriaceae bacterium]|nr:aminopeptidase P family protein [Cyclobacteriaceae bacterium]MCH8516660.1 aminopeptidase P family protein [Cyclobacteriaceae bacterium]